MAPICRAYIAITIFIYPHPINHISFSYLHKMKNIAALLLILVSSLVHSQTVGVLSKTDDALDGYTFFSPFSGTKAYMVDNCGNLINEWDRGTRPGLSAYFLDNGLMLRTYKPTLNGPFTSASNAGGLEVVDWGNNTVWSFEINTAEQLSHHDAVMMPNGNILILTWELTYREELESLGRDPGEIANEDFMWSEKILELQPIGTNEANIIWQWHINDHYIQDFDETKVGFGVISDHPELFNINLPELNSSNSNATRDWNHFNAIDYNEGLDQILLSVRNSDEIWIIDHSTTMEEASSHEGGIYGKGGDILYRWGNASAYEGAQVSDQQLFGQHGVNWVRSGLENEGEIMIFNNGNGKPGADFSQVELLNPPQDSAGFYFLESDATYGPVEANTTYGDLLSERFYSAYLSNAQRLPNGNTLINAGSPGRIIEVTTNDEIVWEYEIPLFGDTPATQGQSVNNNGNFRAYKFPNDFAGFDGIDLTPGLPIENNPLDCELNVATEDDSESAFHIWYDAMSNSIRFDDVDLLDSMVEVFDMQGRLITRSATDNQYVHSLPRLIKGVYAARILTKDGIGSIKFIVE
ncbi:MAG: hypothetical protein ACI86M_001552 [Saprospiraceae bacterium]